MKPTFVNNNKERLPFEHYFALFQEADPKEIAARTALPFDEEQSCFSVKLMGSLYTVSYPDFEIEKIEGQDDCLSCGWAPAQILLLRYLTSGEFSENTAGTFSAYQEMPWGPVYYQNFYGRCILRLAYTFNNREEALKKAMEAVGGVPYKMGDTGFEFPFMEGLSVRIAIWHGDDEFGPSAQILFSDNFRQAFTAEDMAFVGDIFIRVLKGQ